MTLNQKKKKSIPTDSHMTQMPELAEMNFKTTIIKKSDHKMDRVKKMQSFNRKKIDSLKKIHMDILELKKKIPNRINS